MSGYTVALCEKITAQIKSGLWLSALKLNLVAVKFGDRIRAVREHRVDLTCGDADTLVGRQSISYSIPVYSGGIAALVRSDAPTGFKEVLSGVSPAHPLRRASPAELTSQQTV